MATKPSFTPRWAATSPGVITGAVTTPSAGKRDIGYIPGERGAAQFLNWALENIYEWCQFVNDSPFFIGRQILTAASGTYTPSAGTLAVRVRMVGGGGGGGGAFIGTANFIAGSGGSGGTFWEKWISPGALVTGGAFVCGAAGSAGVGNGATPGAGGDTTIVIQGVTYTAKGGGQGSQGSADVGSKAFVGGVAIAGTSAGDVIRTEQGQPSLFIRCTDVGVAIGGGGGGSTFGTGGAPTTNDGSNGANGNAGTGFGAGGGGAYANTTGGAKNGGAGTAGAIIVEEFA